ncbi:glycosyltransferase family 25 protein [Castellaniella caeni]|uniref:glycosyltransferase family 25 protein n=1 Tax=Castellaniella caeni TaxID=266123 RepID=UPI000C9F84F8|nr:glycosyltransferase family 25 protein [Castellaniella caeni]
MIFVISLRDEIERRDLIRKKMDDLSMGFEFIDAIDLRKSNSSSRLVDVESVNKNIHRNMANVEIACALSHRLVYRTILDRGLAGAFVFEDDVIIDDDFSFVNNWFLNNANSFRDSPVIVHLGVSSRKHMNALLLRPIDMAGGEKFKLWNLIQKFSDEAWGAYAYYINSALASKILNQKMVVTVADQWSVLTGGGEGCIKIVSPACCSHPESSASSFLEKGRVVAKYQYLKCFYKDPFVLLGWVYRKTLIKFIIRPLLRKWHGAYS